MMSIKTTSSSIARLASATAFACAVWGPPAHAVDWSESGDAGQLTGAAQVTSGPAGQTLDTISGTISSTQDVDLYRIQISNPSGFSASTTGGDSPPFDAVMALFDAEGFGVYLNDDGAFNVGDPTLPAGHPLGPSSAGIYYIAIFSDETLPFSGAGASIDDLIFPIPDAPYTDVVGPTGGGGGAPLSGWATQSVFALGNGYTIFLTGAVPAESTSVVGGPVVAAVLPASRSVQVGDTATAFATIINAGSVTATACGIAPPAGLQAAFSYQTTNANNALIGTADTPVDIVAGGSQSYVFAFTPTAPFSPTDVQLSFDCTNTDPAPVTVGLNTLLLVADSGPVPDIVALGATLTGDGIVNVENGSGVFSVATVNVGVAGSITASVDTGSASLPQLSIALCETNPATGVCINPTTPTTTPVTTSIAADATPTFAFFVTSTASVPFDPANNRIFVRFKDAGGVTRGATSVAVRTQ